MRIPGILLAASLLSPIPLQSQDNSAVQDKIRAVEASIVQDLQIGDAAPVNLADRMKAYKIAGLSIAVIKDFGVHWAKGYGVKDAEKGDPVTEETLFQAASITKSISAAVTLKLVQDGVLDLDRNVNEYLKRWKVPDNEFTRIEKVTLRRILSHTAGLTVSGMASYAEGAPIPTILQVLDGLPPATNVPVRVDRVPGAEYKYSGGGFTALQVLLEDVTGRSLPDLAAEFVFKPAGMIRSVICLCHAPALAGQAASGHGTDGVPFKGHAFTQGGSGCCELWTTASDLARYVIALQKSMRGDNGAFLSRSMSRLMMSIEREGGRGLGLVVRRYGDAVYFGHDGGNPGYVGRILGHPEKGYGLAVLINSNPAGSMLDDLTQTLAHVYGWDGIQPTRYQDSSALVAELRARWKASPGAEGQSEESLGRQGYFILRVGYPEAGIAVLMLMVEINPRSASAESLLGGAYELVGNREEALRHYRKAIELLELYPESNKRFGASKADTLKKIRKLDSEIKK